MNAMSFETRHNLSIGLRYALLILIAIIFIFPILFMVMSSLKPDLQMLRDSASLRAFLPVGDISLNNYDEAFTRDVLVLYALEYIGDETRSHGYIFTEPRAERIGINLYWMMAYCIIQ